MMYTMRPRKLNRENFEDWPSVKIGPHENFPLYGSYGIGACASIHPCIIFLHSQVHRLVVVNDQRHVKGVVSLSDVLKYLVLTSHTDT
jgi:CBS domain-containing protein